MYAKQITLEQTCALVETRKIINKEKQQKRELLLHKAKQKLLGLFAIAVSIASPLLLEGDATISVIMLPLGIYVLCTKKNILD